jgi:hypothetical protein
MWLSQSFACKRGSLALFFVTATNTRPVTGVLRIEGEKEISILEPDAASTGAARAGRPTHASAVTAIATVLVSLKNNRLVTG